ncbi:MAG: hypothetical protein QG551_311 [Patescibacteria group bacterium]|nr:hypothetical protein [Patescibacteria group bacterium]
MIYLFSGNNFEKRKKAFETELKRFSSHETVIFDDQSFSKGVIENYLSSNSMFSSEMVFIFEHVLENNEIKEYIFEKIKDFKESKHIFFFLESSIKKTELSKIEKHIEKSFIFEEDAKKTKDFNIFAVTDAFGRRDKKETWVIIQKALRSNVPPMDIANILIWSLKNMLLVKDKKGTEEEIKKTKLNPFVFKKSLSASKNFKGSELKNLLSGLIFLYHDERRGESLKTDLELFILKSL